MGVLALAGTCALAACGDDGAADGGGGSDASTVGDASAGPGTLDGSDTGTATTGATSTTTAGSDGDASSSATMGDPDLPGDQGCDLPPPFAEHSAEQPRALVVHTVDTAAHPDALCNDGSPAVYVVRPGIAPGRDRWLVHLDGGGACFDLATCTQRWNSDGGGGPRRNMGSGAYTQAWADDEVWSGILSTDADENPLFHDATHVKIMYCSSDLWGGDKAAVAGADDTSQWHFRGRAIVAAVIDELKAQGLDDAREIAFVGTSAGGFGVYNNADDVAAMVPADARYVAIADAGYFIDYPSIDPATHDPSTDDPTLIGGLMQSGMLTWGGRGDASCEAAMGAELCRGPQTMAAMFIDTPMFVQQSQLDDNQLVRLGTHVDPVSGVADDALDQPYVDGFSARMRELYDTIDARHAIFSRLDGFHTSLDRSADGANGFVHAHIGDVTLSDFLVDWYADPCAPQRLVEQP